MKESPRSEEGTQCPNCHKNKKDTDRSTQTQKRSARSIQTTHSHICFRKFRPVAHTPSFSLFFLSPHPSPLCHSPSMVRDRLLFAVTLAFQAPIPLTLPQENLSDTANTVNKENPATLSCPNTHPSFLGREGPWSCPNPRERAPPPRLTNPARRLQQPGTRCCALTPHSQGRSRLPSKS